MDETRFSRAGWPTEYFRCVFTVDLQCTLLGNSRSPTDQGHTRRDTQLFLEHSKRRDGVLEGCFLALGGHPGRCSVFSMWYLWPNSGRDARVTFLALSFARFKTSIPPTDYILKTLDEYRRPWGSAQPPASLHLPHIIHTSCPAPNTATPAHTYAHTVPSVESILPSVPGKLSTPPNPV